CCTKANKKKLTTSDKIDRVVTNRILALPIFAVIMFLVYYISVTTVGTWATDWANDGVFGDGWHLFGIGASAYEDASGEYGKADQIIEAIQNGETSVDITDDEGNVEETVNITPDVQSEAQATVDAGEPDPADYGVWVPGVPVIIGNALDAVGCADWLNGLILDGIVAGVGAVLGFVPQMLVLFIFLAFLEACGYMARVAFIMDRIFRKFGLSGKSFIPMLIGSGCGVQVLWHQELLKMTEIEK
ncbi:MAG: nucleoside recognition domain-containing protein, partial [Muribaculaceae bacterium]